MSEIFRMLTGMAEKVVKILTKWVPQNASITENVLGIFSFYCFYSKDFFLLFKYFW